MRTWLKPQLVTGAIVLLLFAAAQPPRLGSEKRAELAEPLLFEEHVLAPSGAAGRQMATERRVNAKLDHIRGWISAVGAGVALADLDADGRENDVCLVDPRTDTISVAPAPTTGDRYFPFILAWPMEGYKDGTTAPMGCLPADIDGDGLLDLVAYFWGRTPILFRRDPARDFSAAAFRPEALVEGSERWFTNAAIFTDIDGDGRGDLLFGNYFADGSRILDTDSSEDAYMQHSMSRAANGGRNRLFLASSDPDDPPFIDASDALFGLSGGGWTLALGAADLDGDLRPEIYVANDFGPDRLLHNRSTVSGPRFALAEGKRGFATPRSRVVGRDSFKGMGVDFGDVDGDGRLDIYVSNIAEPYALHESHFVFIHSGRDDAFLRGVAPYTDKSGTFGLARSAWSWDARLADLDNDGRLEALQATGFLRGDTDRWPELHELAMGNDELLRHAGAWPLFAEGADLSGREHDRLFKQDAAGRFWDVAPIVGIGSAQVSRGIALADIDDDGDLDFAIARQWAPSSVFVNEAAAGASLRLDLRLYGRKAVGAEARVTLPDGRRLVEQLHLGNGHSGKNGTILHFGLGAVAPGTALPVELRWRETDGVHVARIVLSPGKHALSLDDIAGTVEEDAGRKST